MAQLKIKETRDFCGAYFVSFSLQAVGFSEGEA